MKYDDRLAGTLPTSVTEAVYRAWQRAVDRQGDHFEMRLLGEDTLAAFIESADNRVIAVARYVRYRVRCRIDRARETVTWHAYRVVVLEPWERACHRDDGPCR